MGRPKVEFTDEQEREIHRLFKAGMSTEVIGKLLKCGRLPIQRFLTMYYNEDLRTVRSRLLQDRKTRQDGGLNLDYREGFEAGYRLALTHVNLHGLGQARNFCNEWLLPWREDGRPDRNGNVTVPTFRA